MHELCITSNKKDEPVASSQCNRGENKSLINLAQNQSNEQSIPSKWGEDKYRYSTYWRDHIEEKLLAGQLNLICQTAFYNWRLRGGSTVNYSHNNLIICHIQSGHSATYITNNQVFLGAHDPALGHACHNPHNPATVTGNEVLLI